MAEDETDKPEEVLAQILSGLQSDNGASRLQAIAQLEALNYSSPLIRVQLEKLALHDENQEVRKAALAALDFPTSRHVSGRTSTLNRVQRQNILNEMDEWRKSGLLNADQAEVLRRRYDFDLAPRPAVPGSVSSPQRLSAETAQPSLPATPIPPRTLTQTLLSETSIKIALYLGAFFVIAAAIILGTLVEAARLPILIVSLAIFGGLALVIRKRLPQPSFALFIVFSFLLPITANVISDALNLEGPQHAAYWVLVLSTIALIWGYATWLYESRLFSVTAFVSFAIALYRVGDVVQVEQEFFAAMLGLAALAGLTGVWALRKWKNASFALPLFLAAQALQAGSLLFSLTLFALRLFDSADLLWNLVSVFTWAFAFCFYAFSDFLFPFAAFPWLAAGTLIPIPWFIGAAFEDNLLGAVIVSFIWGLIVATVSEAAYRLEAFRKYSLPTLVASLFILAVGLMEGFSDEPLTGFFIALGIFFIYGILHLLRARSWLWAIALLNFIIAYFTFFTLPLVKNADVYMGYQLLGLSLIFLLPDLFLKNDFKANLAWRFPPRIYGAFFTLLLFVILGLSEEEPFVSLMIIFAVYAIFFAIYALRYQQPLIGYVSTLALVILVVHVLYHFNSDMWLPALTALGILYFSAGLALRSQRNWSLMLRNSALVLEAGISLVALFTLKETGGWYAFVAGLLFAAEIYLRRNGWFEIGLPVLFNIGTFLILRDFHVDEISYHLLAYSLIWLLSDVLAHLTFVHPRELKWPVRGVGAFLALLNFGFLLSQGMSDPRPGILCFGIYTLLFLTVSLLYRQPVLFYIFTATLPLFVAFLFRDLGVTKWIHPVIAVAVLYYATGYFFRRTKRLAGWDTSLLFSGLGLGLIVSAAAPVLGGLDAAIPVAIAATLWAVEAFERKNVWLGFPTNALYLLAYFIILIELKVDEPQFFSMGAALLGLIQHYLLTRAGSKTGAFITGMVSQLILLGTTYIQMLNMEELIYFVVLFFQSIAVLVYGLVIRSRSLTFSPIGFVVLGVVTVIYSALKGISTVVLIGCTGIILLMLGIAAVLMRERITRLGERLSGWQA